MDGGREGERERERDRKREFYLSDSRPLVYCANAERSLPSSRNALPFFLHSSPFLRRSGRRVSVSVSTFVQVKV